MKFNYKPLIKYGIIGVGFIASAVKEMMDKNENDAKMKEFAAEAVKDAIANMTKAEES